MLDMAKMINLNADIAEGWGAYDIGNDAELMKIIKSASVACGFHAGDPNTMHRLCMLAKQEGRERRRASRLQRSVGLRPPPHPDEAAATSNTWSPIRSARCRRWRATPGLKVTHLKPHGALNNMAAEDEGYAMAIGRAIKTVDRNIIYVALYGSQMQKAAEKLGLPPGARRLPRPHV